MDPARKPAPAQPPQPADAQPALELVPPAPPNSDRQPEQLPLLRVLRLVESIHSQQRLLAEGLKDIKENLPVQRKPLSKRTQQLHILATATRRNGRCGCCQETPVCTEAGRLPGSEYDHFFARNRNGIRETWLVCADCNQRLLNSEFKTAARSAFESYQQALRPLLQSRQTALGLTATNGE